MAVGDVVIVPRGTSKALIMAPIMVRATGRDEVLGLSVARATGGTVSTPQRPNNFLATRICSVKTVRVPGISSRERVRA